MTKARDEEDEDQCFYESHDRLISCSCSTSASTSNSDDEEDDNDHNNDNSNSNSPNYAPDPPLPVLQFPFAMCKYDIWISELSSISERRTRLLRDMGLAGDPSLSRSYPAPAADLREMGNEEFGRSVSSGHLICQLLGESADCTAGISRSKSDGAADRSDLSLCAESRDHCNKSSSSSNSVSASAFCSSSILSNHSVAPETEISSFANNRSHVVKSRCGNGNGSPVAGATSPSKPPSGQNCKRVDEIRSTSSNLSMDFGPSSVVPVSENAGCGEMEEGVDCIGVDRVNEQACTIRDLDNGKEFVVKEITEDGMWNKLKEVGTGRHLTMEEFELTVGHSPIVQELMRRQNVEEDNKDKVDSNANGGSGGGSKLKKKGSWFKSIKSVASSVAGLKERWNSDEIDTSSEKGGRRSSSATDDSQDATFHRPERVRARQYGKSCKELTGLYKSQEIQAHNGSIWSIKFSLDGKYLASAGEDCVIHVWQVVESERKGELLMEKPEDGNMHMLFVVNGSPEPTLLSPIIDHHPEKKRRGRPSISGKSLGSYQLVVPETVFALTDKPICSFKGHLHDVLDLSWSKSQVSYYLEDRCYSVIPSLCSNFKYKVYYSPLYWH